MFHIRRPVRNLRGALRGVWDTSAAGNGDDRAARRTNGDSNRARSGGDGLVGDSRDAGGHRDDRGGGSSRAVDDNRAAVDRAAAAAGDRSRRVDGRAGRDGHGGGDGSRGAAAGLNGADSRSSAVAASRAVGHGRSARGDGNVLSGVDSLHGSSTRDGGGEAGKEGNGGSSETHLETIYISRK